MDNQDYRASYNTIAEHLFLTLQLSAHLTQDPAQTLAIMREVAALFQQTVEEREPSSAGLLAIHRMEQWLRHWETAAIAQYGVPHGTAERDEPDGPSPRPVLQEAWQHIFALWFADAEAAQRARMEQAKGER